MKKHSFAGKLAIWTALLLLAALLSAAASAAQFEDVEEDDWYAEAVEYATGRGLFQGTSETVFSPGRPMNRGMFVTVLGRLTEVDAGEYDKLLFEDTPATEYFTPYVQWASSYGLVNGTGSYSFSPKRAITRQDIVTLLYRYAWATESDLTYDPHALDSFPDKDTVAGYAKTAMTWAVSHNLIQGSGGKLLPKSSATRAQVAQLFYNSQGFFKEQIPMEPQIVEELPTIIYPQFPRTGDRVKDLINSAKLIPIKTGTCADDIVDQVFSEIFYEGMTTYDKVKACYDYLINHTVYGINENPEDLVMPEGFALNSFDYMEAWSTNDVLRHGIGVCDDYAAAFLVMTRRIGLETYVTGGTIGGQGHAWNNVKINGTYYLFDAQVEDRIAGNHGGAIQYSLFCREQNPSGFNYVSRYTNADMEARFNCFRNLAPALGENGQPIPVHDVALEAYSSDNGEIWLSPDAVCVLYGKGLFLSDYRYTIDLVRATDSKGNEIPIDPEAPSGRYIQRSTSEMEDGNFYLFNEWALYAPVDDTYFFTFRVTTEWGAEINRTIDVTVPDDIGGLNGTRSFENSNFLTPFQD